MKNNRICKLAEAIYDSEKAELFCRKLELLLSEYPPEKIKKTPEKLSGKDVLLIVYGDQISQNNEKPLITTAKIIQKYTDGLINGLHILPFFPSSSDDGFAVCDYKKIAPEIGEWADLEMVCHNFRVMFDAVLNHVSASHEWVIESLKGNPDFADFCIETIPSKELEMVVRPRTLPLLTEFHHAKKGTVKLWTTFSPDQVDLNFNNPELLLKIIDVLLYYVEKGARFIRLDAVAFLWKEIGTECIHHPKTHAIIKLIRSIFDQYCPQVKLISETNVPHQENISYFGQGDEAHLVYQFALPPLIAHAISKTDAQYLFNWAEQLKIPENGCHFFNFTASHDGIGLRPIQNILPAAEIDFLTERAVKHGGFISCRTDPLKGESPYEINISYIDLLSHPEDNEENIIKRFLLSQAIALALPGLPGIYFHSLFGSRSWPEGVKKTGAKRTINRQKLEADQLETELQNPRSFRAKLLKDYLHILRIRLTEEAFSPDASFTPFILHPACFSFQRSQNQNNVFCLHNLSTETIHLNLNHINHENKALNSETFLQNLLLPETIHPDSIILGPLQFKWLSSNRYAQK
jgi:sucrose phosphorylase